MNSREYRLPLLNVQSPLVKIQRFENSSNKVLSKNGDGSISAVHYMIMSEPSTLRPIKSWVVRIEEWSCNPDSTMTAKDVLFIRILNHSKYDPESHNLISDIRLGNVKVEVNTRMAQNAMAAALAIISKIDAGRMPNVKDILKLHQLS